MADVQDELLPQLAKVGMGAAGWNGWDDWPEDAQAENDNQQIQEDDQQQDPFLLTCQVPQPIT